MKTLTKYTAVLISMIIAVAALPSTAHAAGIYIGLPTIIVDSGHYYGGSHYKKRHYKSNYYSNNYYGNKSYYSGRGNKYYAKKYYGNNYNGFSGHYSGKSKYYSKPYSKSRKVVVNKNSFRSGNSFNRSSRTVTRNTRRAR